MGADREEQTAGENLGDRISSKGLSCILMLSLQDRRKERESGTMEYFVGESLEDRWGGRLRKVGYNRAKGPA